jgi:hypothetical protein
VPKPWSIWIVATVAVLAVFSALGAYQNAVQLAQAPDPYGATAAARRFALALPKLPPDVPLGYISDLEIGPKAGTAAFLTAQYAVAPHALIPIGQAPAPEWAVGNFAQPGDYAAAGARLGYAVVADVGSGVVIFRRKQ